MKTEFTIRSWNFHVKNRFYLFLLLLLAWWYYAPLLLSYMDLTTGNIDQSIWLLPLLATICWLLMLLLSGMVFKALIAKLGLGNLKHLVLQFKQLTLWQQFVMYWASFALLLVSAMLSLLAIF